MVVSLWTFLIMLFSIRLVQPDREENQRRPRKSNHVLSSSSSISPVYLIYANRRDIRLVHATKARSNQTVVASNLDDATALDFYYADQSIFWTDITLEAIMKTWLNGSKIVTVIADGLVSPDGLACDWLAKKIYWTDSETNRIEVSNLDGTYRKVLFWENLDQPRALALDPKSGLMFWSDWGEKPKIERASLDGAAGSREVIVKNDIYWPNGITVDYATSKIYWADARLNFIDVMDFDGRNRKRLRSGESDLPHPFGITVYSEEIFWTDWSTKSIHASDKDSKSKHRIVQSSIFSPMDVKAFMSARQPEYVTPCAEDNGGCSHLCLLSYQPPHYTCACPTGVKLKPDGKTCLPSAESMLLLARRPDLRRISLDMPDYTDVVIPLDRVQHIVAVDYDPIDGFLYWSDDELRMIQRAKLDGSQQEVVIQHDLVHPDGIAIDWVARNLYWTDTGTDRIEVSRLDGQHRKMLISEKLDEPRAIVVDPSRGYMYWSDWGKKAKIERATLSGANMMINIKCAGI